MRPAFFTVVVANSSLNTASPSDGFIDPKPIEQYMAEGDSPTTLVQTTAKRRGNKRWKKIFEKLGLLTNTYVDPLSIVCDGTATTDPTSITFTLQVEGGLDSLHTENESALGTYLTGAAAVKRGIARALANQESKMLDVYDPTETAAANAWNANTAVRRGVVVAPVVVGKLANTLTLAEAAITVTQI